MSAETDSFTRLVEYLKQGRGFDFDGYKTIGLARRIKKRMQTIHLEDFNEYIDYLEVHPDEYDRLFDTILINVTSFFRDPAAWDFLREKLIPEMIATRNGSQIRVWSAGCSSGEEAFTLAMAFAEAIGHDHACERLKIYATDVDEGALNIARAGLYAARDLEALPEGFADRYFQKQPDGRFAFDKDLRRCVIFGRHDLFHDAPISRIQLLCCRNVLMYFNAESQSKILTKFHFALHESGTMFLGRAETLLSRASLFTPINLPMRFFSKVPALNLRDRLLIMATSAGFDGTSGPIPNAERLRDGGFDASPQAQILVDLTGVLVLANERARELLRIQVTDIGRSLVDMDVARRPYDIREAMERALSERRPQVLREVETLVAGERTFTDIQIIPLKDLTGIILGLSITFTDVSRHRRMQDDLQRSGQELEEAYEELQSTTEELETTNEELQSTVEELETTNEELQSSNEELETMNQELQSTNEQLNTTSDETEQRSDDVSSLNKFLQMILGSLMTAVIAVDRNMVVTAWNSHSEELWGLRTDEVLGEHLMNLDSGLPVEQLRQPIQETLSDEGGRREIHLEAVNRRGRNIACNVTCLALREATGERHGVILLIDQPKDAEPATSGV